MLNAPDTATLKGLRGKAILAVMLGCGLRREEVVLLTVEHLQQREGRWVILDLTGKHNQTRTVPMAAWIKALIDTWTAAASIRSGVLFRRILKGGHLQTGGMTSQAVWDVVQAYAPVENLDPMTCAERSPSWQIKRVRPLGQIQKTLGHASIQTTERYIGADQNLQNAPSDSIKLDITK